MASPPFTVDRLSSAAQLEQIIAWASKEGWNPGVDDASCFFAADPTGFFVGKLATPTSMTTQNQSHKGPIVQSSSSPSETSEAEAKPLMTSKSSQSSTTPGVSSSVNTAVSAMSLVKYFSAAALEDMKATTLALGPRHQSQQQQRHHPPTESICLSDQTGPLPSSESPPPRTRGPCLLPLYAFLGCYIVIPEQRGHGYGIATWRAAVEQTIQDSKAFVVQHLPEEAVAESQPSQPAMTAGFTADPSPPLSSSSTPSVDNILQYSSSLSEFKDALFSTSTLIVGLDGVAQQVSNYERSGFKCTHRNIRFQLSTTAQLPISQSQSGAHGVVERTSHVITASQHHHASCTISPMDDTTLPDVEAYDRQCFPATRSAFLQRWLHQDPSHANAFVAFCPSSSNSETKASEKQPLKPRVVGYAVVRKCMVSQASPAQHCFKVGPLFADNASVAQELFDVCCKWTKQPLAGASPAAGKAHTSTPTPPLVSAASSSQVTIFLDVPEVNPQAMALVRAYKMSPVFETTRMYAFFRLGVDEKKSELFEDASFEEWMKTTLLRLTDLARTRVFGVTSLELG